MQIKPKVHENAEIKRMTELGESMDFDPTGGSLGRYKSQENFQTDWNRHYEKAHQEALVEEYTWLANQVERITGIRMSMPQVAVADFDRLGTSMPGRFRVNSDFDFIHNKPSFEGVDLHQHHEFPNFVRNAEKQVTIPQSVATQLGLPSTTVAQWELVAAVRTYKP